MKHFQKKPWMTPSEGRRQGTSTGTRVSSGRFSPYSPKGGFADPIYQGGRYIAKEYFDYDPLEYYEQRLFGDSPDDVTWRYDLNKHIIGRDYHQKGNYVPSWLPRFPKKGYESPYTELQESSQYGIGKFQRRVSTRTSSKWKRPKYQQADICNRRGCACRQYNKIYRSTVHCDKRSRYALFRKLLNSVYSKQSNSSKPGPYWR